MSKRKSAAGIMLSACIAVPAFFASMAFAIEKVDCYKNGDLVAGSETKPVTELTDPAITWDDPEAPEIVSTDDANACDNPAGKKITTEYSIGHEWKITAHAEGEVKVGVWKAVEIGGGGGGQYEYGQNTNQKKIVECNAAA